MLKKRVVTALCGAEETGLMRKKNEKYFEGVAALQ